MNLKIISPSKDRVGMCEQTTVEFQNHIGSSSKCVFIPIIVTRAFLKGRTALLRIEKNVRLFYQADFNRMSLSETPGENWLYMAVNTANGSKNVLIYSLRNS